MKKWVLRGPALQTKPLESNAPQVQLKGKTEPRHKTPTLKAAELSRTTPYCDFSAGGSQVINNRERLGGGGANPWQGSDGLVEGGGGGYVSRK